VAVAVPFIHDGSETMNVLIIALGSLQLAGAGVARVPDGVAVDASLPPVLAGPWNADLTFAPDSSVPSDTIRRRPRAIDYSDAYYKRLTIHRIGSYAMLPLFAAEYALGQRLLTGTYPPRWIKPAHGAVAGGLGVLFTVNTVTGGWNLWDARHDESDRTRRFLHTGLMLASDAGFAWAGAIGGSSNNSLAAAHKHRNVAIGSMAISTVGTAMMWLWKN
jgi:hypothetical protein